MSISNFNEFLNLPAIHAIIWLLISGGIFSVLQEFFPHDKEQPRIRKDAYVDVFYWIFGALFFTGIATFIIMTGFYVIFAGDMDKAAQFLTNGAPWTKTMPIWVQAILVLIITDFSLYWTHRIFHMNARLWKFHAIHHGAQNMDWMHSVRFHPVNIIFHTLIANAIVLWLGFSPLAIAVLGPFNTLYSCMVHANLNWTFGKFGYIFASPVFHRWHHTSPEEGGDKNFAATFPILDVIFGTYYMPEGKLPGKTGLYEDYVPKTLAGQMLYPFMPEEIEEPKEHIAAE